MQACNEGAPKKGAPKNPYDITTSGVLPEIPSAEKGLI